MNPDITQNYEARVKRQAEHLDKKWDGESYIQAVPAKDAVVVTAQPEHVVEILTFLRDDQLSLFTTLIDLTVVDYPAREKRFEVVYQLLSLKYNVRLRLKVSVAEGEVVPTATNIFSSAQWYEREVWDMYGVPFADNPDLRRILTDYGFLGHPQRKDFPLTGHVEVHYDEELKRVVYAPVKLDQNYRQFDFESPWEGTDYALPETLEKRAAEIAAKKEAAS